MVFCRQDRPVTIEVGFLVESREISWKNRPVTIKVGFLLESAS